MFTRILLPLDGSELSAQAVPHTLALAKATGAEAVIVRVIDSEAQIIAQTSPATIEPLPSGRITAEIAGEVVEGQRQAATETVTAAKAEFDAAGVPAGAELLEGSPGDQIVAAAERHGCDVVVMATRGRGGWKRAVLGSVADHVVREVEGASVLLIRPEGEED
ncbi:MAG: universal stress protein [Dehalococcoidia bacterium]|nr:universal stress protein [Dehalococcoidia bacterium]